MRGYLGYGVVKMAGAGVAGSMRSPFGRKGGPQVSVNKVKFTALASRCVSIVHKVMKRNGIRYIYTSPRRTW